MVFIPVITGTSSSKLYVNHNDDLFRKLLVIPSNSLNKKTHAENSDGWSCSWCFWKAF